MRNAISTPTILRKFQRIPQIGQREAIKTVHRIRKKHLNSFPNCVAIRPYHHRPSHRTVVSELRVLDHVEVPSVEILRPRRDRPLLAPRLLLPGPLLGRRRGGGRPLSGEAGGQRRRGGGRRRVVAPPEHGLGAAAEGGRGRGEQVGEGRKSQRRHHLRGFALPNSASVLRRVPYRR